MSSEWDTILRTNLYAPFVLTRAAVPHMRPGSSIIFTVSDVVYNAVDGTPDYSASKGALKSLVEGLGIGLAAKGIRVNGVAPGLVYTPLLAEAGLTTEQLEQTAQTLPLKRPSQPVEMAPVYVDFADATMTYTSGGVWANNGGTQGYLFG
jgi:NAD(P)-dependent dehydrogenase (short-subunit alcohol dehydrogenase family)